MGYVRYHKTARWAWLWEMRTKGVWKEGLLGSSPITTSSQLSKHVQFIAYILELFFFQILNVIGLKHNSEIR